MSELMNEFSTLINTWYIISVEFLRTCLLNFTVSAACWIYV